MNSIGGSVLLNVSHTSPVGERVFSIQGEFLPGAGAEVGMLDFEAKLMESNLDDGVNGECNSKGSTTVKKTVPTTSHLRASRAISDGEGSAGGKVINAAPAPWADLRCQRGQWL